MRYPSLVAPGLAMLAIATGVALMFSSLMTSQAVQNPTISLDMVTSGNTYSDPGAGGDNSMTVGTINSSSSGCPGNNLTHTHTAHFVIRDVEDLIGWQARLNYDGGQMRPNTVNFGPFMDTGTGQLVSFVNLPIDSATGVHRGAITAVNIPGAAPGPQTAAVGSTYEGTQNFAVSPDTPAKAVPDDTSYSAPAGGVLASLNLQVLAGNDGQTLSMDLDDAVPNAPGSGVAVFTGAGSMEILLSESALGDGSHLEGVNCASPTPTMTPPAATPTPTATPTATATPPLLGTLRMSLDMNPSGNSYSDPGVGGNNSMTVGTIDDCLTLAAPGDNASHFHATHVIAQNVHDLVGWQARLNYDGGKMRPSSVNFTPFTDTTTSENISFVNLPVDSALGVHRGLVTGSNIPPAAPGPQTASLGSTYVGALGFAVSADTPPKPTPDDTSYSALFGGVLATLNLQVLAGNAGQQSLFMNLDDSNPNAPGSEVVVFDGVGTQEINILPENLGDGYHGEGASCVPLDCVNNECPSVVTPTPTPTLTPAGHDASLTRISGVPSRVRLSPGEIITSTTKITVANEGAHSDTIGVYVDVQATAAGGCGPNGRMLETTVTLAAGAKATLSIPVSYSCADPAAANGLNFLWTAVADHGADDLSSCDTPQEVSGGTCSVALANDDEDDGDNIKIRPLPKVIAQ